MTDNYFIYYAVSSALCVIIFGIMLAHNKASVDRQEKQIKYDYALISFMLYFISDSIWAAVDTGVLPVNTFSAIATDFANYVIMTWITYAWLNYVLAVEQTPHRNRRLNRFAVIFPFLISSLVLIALYLIDKSILLDAEYKATPVFYLFLVTVPYIYIIAVIVYTVKRAIREENPAEKRKHLFIGLFPIVVVIGGLIQMFLVPWLPIYCYCSTVLMLIFYIRSIDEKISTDPLTRLNNRGQLMRYVSQRSNLRKENRTTCVVMIDINDFKSINDSYGHSEGDSALIITSEALESVAGNSGLPVFLGRYGGDEFVMIVFVQHENELTEMIDSIRKGIQTRCAYKNKPYRISVGVGYDVLQGENDTFQKCLQRADKKLYLDKEYCKINGAAEG